MHHYCCVLVCHAVASVHGEALRFISFERFIHLSIVAHAPLPSLQPFIEEGHPLGKLFPPVEALFMPACLLISSVVALICIHVGVLVIREALRSR